jgi:hypothetical protein
VEVVATEGTQGAAAAFKFDKAGKVWRGETVELRKLVWVGSGASDRDEAIRGSAAMYGFGGSNGSK